MSALLVRRRPLPIKITPLEGIVLPRADLGLEQRLINAGVRRVDHDFSSRLFTLEAPAGPRKLCLAPCKAFMQDLSWFDKNITSIGFQFALVEDILAFFGSEYRSLREEYDILAPGSTALIGEEERIPFIPQDESEPDLCLSWYRAEIDEKSAVLLVDMG